MTCPALLLSPSCGLGGGIERYVSTIEAALRQEGVQYRRLDLASAERPARAVTRLCFVRDVASAVRRSSRPMRLIVAHRNLLPAIYPAARFPNYGGTTVILHGSELWSGRPRRGHRPLRRSDVRAVAVSTFTAGALANVCRSAVLHPGVPAEWYGMLVEAGEQAKADRDRIDLVTAFRLWQWREKGLSTLLEAISMLRDERVRLTVCGSGPVPADLRDEISPYPWCELAVDLKDQDLAWQMARADLVVLCTRTRAGARACGEGFGLVLLEAQLAGTPVVAPARGGSSDAFLHEVTGVAPEDESPQALRAVLARLLADAPRRAEMGHAAANWSRARFEPNSYGRRVVRTLLGAPTHPPEGCDAP